MTGPRGSVASFWYAGEGGRTSLQGSTSTDSAAATTATIAPTRVACRTRASNACTPRPARTETDKAKTSTNRAGARISVNAGTVWYKAAYSPAAGPNEAQSASMPSVPYRITISRVRAPARDPASNPATPNTTATKPG